jgi:hypothetical protein
MKVRIKSCPMAANGLQVEGNQQTPISDNMTMIGGKTHEQRGTDISYNGQQVEAEKGEPVSIGNKGEAIVWGNMNLPGSSKKFKTVAKDLGEKEEKYSKLDDKANVLLSQNAPDNKWERLAWNSGRVMQIGVAKGQADVNQKKEQLANLQKALLQTAQEHNIDPQELSMGNIKKAKKGAFLPYMKKADDGTNLGPGDGKPSRSDRNNNPGNIKYGKYAKLQGATGQDANGFAIFSDPTQGSTAMQNLLLGGSYKDLPVGQAITKWTGGKPYDLTGLGNLQGKKVSDLAPDELGTVLNYMKQGEGTKYGQSNPGTFQKSSPTPGGNNPFTGTPYNYTPGVLPDIPLTADQPTPTPEGATPPPQQPISTFPDKPIPTNAQNLDLKQIIPELYGFATNKEVPVALQKYNPQQYIPYQMSFQDQINDNSAEANQLYRRTEGNPALASSIGAGVYDANNKVRANEFRTNQGIQADTINKNVQLNNDAQLKNLQLSDTQFTRQSEARSRTKEINQAILSSISSKYLQNDLQTKSLQAYENLYNYRFADNGRANYYGPDAQFRYGPGGDGTNTPNENARIIRDGKGNIIRTVTPSEQTIQGQDYLNQERKRKVDDLNRRFYQSLGK